jgi:hypothetical protein
MIIHIRFKKEAMRDAGGIHRQKLAIEFRKRQNLQLNGWSSCHSANECKVDPAKQNQAL